MTQNDYGRAPEITVPELDLDWTEFMHYLYLPVVMPYWDAGEVLQYGHIRLPPNLEFAREAVELACEREQVIDDDGDATLYVYVTARRGFASPGNALNRPGWHADGFGSKGDINFIWADAWPTQIAEGNIGPVSDDHIESAHQFNEACERAKAYPGGDLRVYDAPVKALVRLDPYVLHAVPVIPAPGGERSFLKISVSKSRYNLLGNSHNHIFDYAWPMYSRDKVRNDPSWAGGDSFKGA